MSKKFIFSCLISYVCLVFHISLINATVIEKYVLEELKRQGYEKPPDDVENWKAAFRSLAHEISTLRSNCTRDILVMNATIDKLCLHYSSIYSNYSILQNSLAAAVNATIYWETNYHQATAILILRGDIEDIEDTFNSEFPFPTRQTMLDTLKRKQNKQVKFPDMFTEDETKLLKDLKPETNIHTLKWLYYLSNCETTYAENIRIFFKTNKILALQFCELVGSIYEKTCHGIHRAGDSKLSTDAIISGLKLYGIRNEGMLECAKYLFLLAEVPGVLPKAPTT